jgi:hypothetical protein
MTSQSLLATLTAGFLAGSIVPAGIGIEALYLQYMRASALGPDEGICGMGSLYGLAMIFVISPCCGLLAAVLAGTIFQGTLIFRWQRDSPPTGRE